MKSNKSISRKKFFGPNFIFCNFKTYQESIFELGKSLKPNIFYKNYAWFSWKIFKFFREIDLFDWPAILKFSGSLCKLTLWCFQTIEIKSPFFIRQFFEHSQILLSPIGKKKKNFKLGPVLAPFVLGSY